MIEFYQTNLKCQLVPVENHPPLCIMSILTHKASEDKAMLQGLVEILEDVIIIESKGISIWPLEMHFSVRFKMRTSTVGLGVQLPLRLNSWAKSCSNNQLSIISKNITYLMKIGSSFSGTDTLFHSILEFFLFSGYIDL